MSASYSVSMSGLRSLLVAPRRRRGQALVEFALVFPVFMLLLVIAIDFGRLYFTYIQVSNAAREATAYAATEPTDVATMTIRAQQEKNTQGQGEVPLQPLAVVCQSPAGTTIPCTGAGGASGAGNTVTVTVGQQFSFLTPLLNDFFGGGLTINASASTAVLVSAVGGTGGGPGSCAAPSNATFTVTASGPFDVIVDPDGSKPDAGSCTISGYNWDFGDGITGVGTTIPATHSYASAGTYTITLTVTNQGGTLSALRSVKVPYVAPTPTPSPTPAPTPTGSPSPTATPTATPTPSPTPTATPCTKPVAAFSWVKGSSKTIDFTDKSTAPAECPIMSWLWDFGDASPLTNAPNPSHDFPKNNTNYSVTLTVTSSSGSSSITRQVSS